MLKDFKVTTKHQKTEIKWFVASFCVAFLMNVFAIIYYKTEWKELYSQALWIFILTCFWYAVSVGVRIGIWVACYLYRRLIARK
jgi:ABC-type proline/glycine betaine transport system permease subunit